MLQKFILNLLVAAAKNPDIRAFVFELIEKLAAKLLPDIVATFPTFVAAAMKVFSDKIPNIQAITEGVEELATDTVKHIIDSDPDAPFGLSNIFDVTEWARKQFNL